MALVEKGRLGLRRLSRRLCADSGTERPVLRLARSSKRTPASARSRLPAAGAKTDAEAWQAYVVYCPKKR